MVSELQCYLCREQVFGQPGETKPKLRLRIAEQAGWVYIVPPREKAKVDACSVCAPELR